DILDLSKIESGTVTVDVEDIFFTYLVDMVARPFRHEAESRKLTFDVQLDPKLDRSINTDSKRLQQVLKNLLSNAFKFTEHGGVKLSVYQASSGWSPDHPVLNSASGVVVFEVSDTGIGIPPEKQRIIFEAFQQADASTNRKYGGTGLGLAISRELANLLGGEIQLRSTPNVGSTFTLYLPLRYAGIGAGNRPTLPPGEPLMNPPILVPSRLKQDPATRHIPVQVVTLDEDRQHGLARGAFSFVNKPSTAQHLEAALARIKNYVKPRRKRLLIVEDNPAEQRSIAELLGHDDIDLVTVGTGKEALSAIRQEAPDCVVLDLRLPDMSGFDLLEAIRDDAALSDIPVVVFTGRELSPEEDAQLHTMARSVVVKGVESPERLLDETALFLHRVVSELPEEKQRMIERLHSSDDDLVGKTVLLVDD